MKQPLGTTALTAALISAAPSYERLNNRSALTWPEAQRRIAKLLERGLQKDSEFERQWPSVLGTLFDNH